MSERACVCLGVLCVSEDGRACVYACVCECI